MGLFWKVCCHSCGHGRGSECSVGLGQKVELIGGENEPSLGKRYRKLEKDLCTQCEWGRHGLEPSVLQTDSRMKSRCPQCALWSATCGLLVYCRGIGKGSLVAWRSHRPLLSCCGWKVARTSVADTRGGKARPGGSWKGTLRRKAENKRSWSCRFLAVGGLGSEEVHSGTNRQHPETQKKTGVSARGQMFAVRV